MPKSSPNGPMPIVAFPCDLERQAILDREVARRRRENPRASRSEAIRDAITIAFG